MLRQYAFHCVASPFVVSGRPLRLRPRRGRGRRSGQGAGCAERRQYFPPAGTWAKKAPAELGLDPAKLAEAVTYTVS